jgi:cytochrome c553
MKKLLLTALLITAPTVAAEDRFEDIRKPWAMCSTCHGAMGQGGVGPTLAGQSADEIISKLIEYRMGHKDGPQAAMMIPWAQSLTEGQIGTIGVFVQEGFPTQ